jgi:hypothetical protein
MLVIIGTFSLHNGPLPKELAVKLRPDMNAVMSNSKLFAPPDLVCGIVHQGRCFSDFLDLYRNPDFHSNQFAATHLGAPCNGNFCCRARS